MASFYTDFKAVGTKLMRSQSFVATANTDSEESTVVRHIDYVGDCNEQRTPPNEGQKFEIMVDTLILANRTLKLVRGTYNKCIGVKLRWRFLGKDACTRIIQVRGNEIIANELYSYSIPNDSHTSFFEDRLIHFDVYAIYPNKEKYIGFSELQMSDCAENINMQLGKCLDLLYITKRKCCTGGKVKNIGRLLIQYKLHSPPVRNKAAALKKIIETLQKLPQASLSDVRCRTIETTSSLNKGSSPSVTVKNTSALLDKVTRKVSDSVLSSSNQRKVDHLTEKQQSVFDFFTIGRKRKSGNLNVNPSLPNLSSTKCTQRDHAVIAITINSLKFNEEFGKDLKLNMTYYVEYSFLTKEGLETPNLPLSAGYSSTYEVMTTFKFNFNDNVKDCRIISKMISGQKSIRFSVVEEPLVDPLRVPICVELGYSDINLHDIAHGKNNNTEYTLLSMSYPHEPIGVLNVDITGLENVLEIMQKGFICGTIYDKAKSLCSIEDQPEGTHTKSELKETTATKQDIPEKQTVELKKSDSASSKLKNMLKGRSSSIGIITPGKVTRGDVPTSLKAYRKSSSSKRKKIERARLNRRFTSLIGDKSTSGDFPSHSLEVLHRSESEVVEKSETENTKEKD